MTTAVAMARQATAGGYDLVVTSSTPSLQAVGNNNREGRVRHVFFLVADPYVAGVGLGEREVDRLGAIGDHVRTIGLAHPGQDLL